MHSKSPVILMAKKLILMEVEIAVANRQDTKIGLRRGHT